MNRPEACAVGWDNDRRGKRSQCIAGLLDQRFGGQATEVEPADDGIDLLNAGQFLGIRSPEDELEKGQHKKNIPFLYPLGNRLLLVFDYSPSQEKLLRRERLYFSFEKL
jgi:hypothetical protein